ncbi:MAG TPA: hypothetical protein VK738_06065 [Terriglobales bacterium]|nr:hypothetical protein [Terriglobales bacterium]
MADEQNPLQPEIEFKTEPPKENRTPGPAIIIGFVFMAVMVGLFILVSHKPQKPGTNVPSAYAAHIQLQDVKLSQAENFVGGTVTYIEGQMANTGDKTVTRATVEAVFKDSMGQVVQQEELPLQVLERSGPYPQAIDLQLSPLKPQQQREFRLTLSHVSSDWNQQAPELKVMETVTQ